jgi:hypothetical protein
MRFSYRNGSENLGILIKHGDEDSVYQIDWADGIGSGVVISSVTSASLDSANASADTRLLDATTNSGTLTTVVTLTGGVAPGTATATDGSRFKITTTANLDNGAELKFRVYVIVKSGGTYGPTA